MTYERRGLAVCMSLGYIVAMGRGAKNTTGGAMSRFYEIEPTGVNYWRAISLFGRNSASYKFALARTLIDVYSEGKTSITLDELAQPYVRHLCEHLKMHPKQGTSEKSTFLHALRKFNSGEIDQNEVVAHAVRHGFANVLDAFHNVHGAEIGSRFFIDERSQGKGIQLTDNFMRLGEQQQFSSFAAEAEARWRLVESAWESNLARSLLMIEYEGSDHKLIGVNSSRRTAVTSARHALNGYQKGRCFYCYRDISIIHGSEDLADVDHFFPHVLKQCGNHKPIDGVANLVLACQECNRGTNGKFEKLPSVSLLDRLYRRNEYLITSHHPLRETLIAQTGSSSERRQSYLQDAYDCSTTYIGALRK